MVIERFTSILSISFDIKLMFDIGRYDLRSTASSDCFFNLGPTIASFCEDGLEWRLGWGGGVTGGGVEEVGKWEGMGEGAQRRAFN